MDTMHISENPVQLSQAEREDLIASYPLFCLLNSTELHELALLAKEIHAKPGDVIVEQNAVIDRVYLIERGTASVTKTVITVDSKHDINVATLQKGDAIGLSAIGIYSQTGMLTAKVMATSQMTLLSIDMKDFHQFLQRPDVTYPALQNATEKILLMQFIQETHIFSNLKKEEMQHLAYGFKKIRVEKGSVIFNEGDLADKCYFILSGQIEISSVRNTVNSVVAVLESSCLFGEGAVLENGRRNATAIAKSDSELFVINKAQLEFLNQHNEVISAINEIRMKQIKPIPKKNVTVIHVVKPEGDKVALVCNQETTLRLYGMEKEIWEEINGINVLADIYNLKHNELNNLTILDLYQSVLKLKEMDLVTLQYVEMKFTHHIKYFVF